MQQPTSEMTGAAFFVITNSPNGYGTKKETTTTGAQKGTRASIEAAFD